MHRNPRIRVRIGDRDRPYNEARWVIFSASGWPVGFMLVEPRHLKARRDGSPRWLREPFEEKAFTDFFTGGPRTPLQAAMEGYTIQLVPQEEADELLKQHLGKSEDKKERQHGQNRQAG